jgi:hypothetical protein
MCAATCSSEIDPADIGSLLLGTLQRYDLGLGRRYDGI